MDTGLSFEVVSENYSWPILVQHSENNTYSIDYPSKGYILFLNPQLEDFEYNFAGNVENLKETPYWNPRSNFLIFACGELEKTPTEFAYTVLSVLKNTGNIINAVLFIFTGDTEETNSTSNGNTTNNTSLEDFTTIYAYTLFPYLNGACNENVIVLIGKWTVHNASEDSFNAIDFFPNKLPRRFSGCVLKVGAIEPEPSVIKSIIRLKMEKRNLKSGETDIFGGFVPAMYPLHLFGDVSIAIFSDGFIYLVPCPNTLMKTEKVVALFRLSTWISMGFVFIFVSVLFWILSHYPTRRNDYTGFNLLSQCFSAAWAVLLGVSEFVYYICVVLFLQSAQCFKLTFTTYLVEPGYEARLETLDDVKRAGLTFGFYDILRDVEGIAALDELNTFESKTCLDFVECVRNVMFKKDSFTAAFRYLPFYVASMSGVYDHSKVVCFLDKAILTLPVGMVFPIGSPLLNIYNVHVRRCLEGGLLQVYMSQLEHVVNLKSNKTVEDNEFVVFSLTHLSPVFMLLFIGCILSVILFVCELIAVTSKIKNQD
ncbi:hypothetical protein L9F63_025285 [Diploptera punctata]|uniref:Uncharacterized protein n=1 Tax=Diploptera punctata TaxID=6984 RepID=A0AAD7ZD94_DIPPU|nr:hypothetical protein L9F63_025285 [Diploptera punctata]